MSNKKGDDQLNISSNENSPASADRYRKIFETVGEGILILDGETGMIIDVNPFMLELLGCGREEFSGVTLREIGLLAEKEFLAAFEELKKKSDVRLEKLALKTRSGAARIVELIGSAYSENDRRVIQCRFRDRTENYRLEEERRRFQFLLAEAQRIAHVGSWEHDFQTGKTFLSDELYRIYDVPPGTFENNSELIRGFIHPEDRDGVMAAFDVSYRQGTPFDFENRIIRSSGEERVVHCLGEVTFDEAGNPLRMGGILQDITERKRAEREKAQLLAQLENERQRLDNVIANVPGFVWESWGVPGNSAQQTNFINNYAETLLGYRPDEWLTTPDFWRSILHPDDHDRAVRVAVENFRNGRDYSQQYRWVGKDGRVVWIESNVAIVRDDQGQPIGMRGINLDITGRKQTEAERLRLMAELDKEKTRLQLIFDNSPAFIVLMRGPDFVFELANPAYYQIVGQRELIGVPAETAFPELAEQGFIEKLKKVYRTGVPFIGNETPAELQLPGKDAKELHYINFAYVPMREADGTISGILCYGIDVTEQVLARKKIQESEARYRFLFQNNPLPMWLFDVDTLRFLSVNDAAVDHYGYSREEFLSMTLIDIRPPEDVPDFLENASKTFPGREKAGFFRHRKKDGTIIYVEIISIQLSFNGKNSELVLANDITERKMAEDAMRQAETNYRNLVESSPGVVYRMQPHPPYATIYVSPNVEKYGYSAEEWYTESVWSSMIHKEDFDRVMREFESAISQGLDSNIEYRIVARDGSIHWWQDKGQFVADERGEKAVWQGIAIDITDTKELEEQLRQSQKLESVGLLAGGIAHDFNNMLTAINGYSDLILRKLKEDDPLSGYIKEIRKAGDRSATLTHQLLAFSRQQVLQPVIADLNEIIADTIKMLQRLIGEDIQLITALNPEIGRVLIDPGQFSQIIMNLAINSRDAMPQGGKLRIETANVFLDAVYTSQHLGFHPGDYVLLAVTDNGTGMSRETQQHVFEPFFTTKELGKGTGLGLATVYGIVKQSGGNIEVESEQGVGTTFKIFLPQVADPAIEAPARQDASTRMSGTETILLVEDESLVRNLSREILETYGYTVIEARNGQEALEICEKGDHAFDLLITDVVMPEMGGRELAEKLTDQPSNLQILFTSGYTDDAVVRHGIIETNTNFIQKPFTPDALANKVREILDHLRKS